MDHVFLVMWCSEGLEFIYDLTKHERKAIMASLKGEPQPSIPNLNHLVLRAKYNTQRHYEIYTVSATEGITEDDLKALFDESPQYAADLIRQRGHKIYSDRADPTKARIV